jgi:sulfoxide reductase catalytic subunit YedY
MLIRKSPDIRSSEITPKHVYLNRRRFLAGLSLAAPALLGADALSAAKLEAAKSPFSTKEKITPFRDVTSYNNFYEFGTEKDEPARYAHTLVTQGWKLSVEGECAKPRVFDMDAILKLAPLEERIYRMRCVERWSIVVPWIGYPLSALLKQVEPKPKAKFVAFQTLYDKKQMPMGAGIPFPYVEGLRLDEAMHPLTILCTGMYGETLPNQNGAPVRIVVPWKYGYKSPKSIVKIRLTEKQPPCSWNILQPSEYGFYSNVNPDRDHPRWSQKKERRLREDFFINRDTLPFNGYGEHVAQLYAGMDLIKNH